MCANKRNCEKIFFLEKMNLLKKKSKGWYLFKRTDLISPSESALNSDCHNKGLC